MRNAWLALLGLLLTIATACGDSEPDLNSYSELLRFVPNDPEYRRWITVVDYEALRSLPPPDNSEGLTAVQDLALRANTYATGLAIEPLGSRAAVAFPEIPANWDTAFGLTVDDADRSLVTGSPPQTVGVLVGSFDADAMVDRLKACDECTQPAEVTRGRNSYYDWGSGLGTGERFALPVFDNLGRGGTYRFTDRYVLHAFDREPITSSLDAITEGTSALEHPGLKQLADALDDISRREDIELLGANLTDIDSGPLGRSIFDESMLEHPTVQSALEEPLPRPHRGVALAVGLRDGEPIAALVLAHSTEANAEENVARLNERLTTTVDWEGRLWSASFPSWEIETDGATLIATLEGEAVLPIALGPTPLLFHE